MSKKEINKMILDIADAVSYNEQTSTNYFQESKVNFDEYLSRGLANLKLVSNTKHEKVLSKSESFFRRTVLAAKIAHECYNEWAFGSVKFQKMVYLCEKSSEMKFMTHYTKQAAGPMDNRFMHKIKAEFEKQGWFKVEKVVSGKFEKVQFTPLEGVNKYKNYYTNYFAETENKIQYLIDSFRKWKTDDVELVATIYASWDEILKENCFYSEQLIIKKVYAWHEKKKKFTEKEIEEKLQWMKEEGIHPKER